MKTTVPIQVLHAVTSVICNPGAPVFKTSDCMQERLRTLRASLGSAKASQATDAQGPTPRGSLLQTQRSRDQKAKKPMLLPSTPQGNTASGSAMLAVGSPAIHSAADAEVLNPAAGLKAARPRHIQPA